MDRLESMALLLAAVETGSLSAASRSLGVPLPTVSRKVSELEAHLRTRLLNRSSRQLTLTDAGRCYVAACRRILDDVKEAERTASGEHSAPKGDLIITALIVFGRLHVLPVAVAFLKTYPDIVVRIVLADRVFNLSEDRVDLAVRIGALPDSSLVATRVGSVRRVVCASSAYFAQRGVPKNPLDLGNHDCITFEGLSSPDFWTFTVNKSEKKIAIRSRLVVNTAEAAIDAAIAGIGMTRVLSYQIASAERISALAVALQAFEPAPWPVNLVYRGSQFLPIKLRAFLDFAVPRLKARLSEVA
jgi:DNA-binding transcriptional LysR family regulator